VSGSRLAANMSALAGLVIVSAVMAGAGGTAAATGRQQGTPPVSISGPSVVPRPPGSWATFTFSLRQGGQGRPFHGELRLVPEDVIAAAPATDTPGTTTTLSPAAAARTTTTRPPRNPAEAVYKAPITLAAGVNQPVPFLVPVGEVSYRPELHDDAGRLVATGSSTKAGGAPVVAIGLLTDRPNGFCPESAFTSGRGCYMLAVISPARRASGASTDWTTGMNSLIELGADATGPATPSPGWMNRPCEAR